MILSNKYLTNENKEGNQINAEITANHPASSYGQPVIVLENGELLDPVSWSVLGYKVVSASPEELAALKKLGLL